MNLRILKKLSKRAAPHMAALGYSCKQYVAESCDSYTSSSNRHDRKHWVRHRARRPSNLALPGRRHVVPRRGDGIIVLSDGAICPWPGTVMLRWSVGYYEPEWEEGDAWSLLKNTVRSHWGEYREIPCTDGCGGLNGEYVYTRRLRNPSAILRALPEVIEARRQEEERRTAAFRAASQGGEA